MKSSSIKELIKRGIDSPHTYRDNLIHEWYLPEWVHENLSTYVQLSIQTPLLFNNINNGEFKTCGDSFSITWIHHPSRIRKANYALLSFRYCPILNRGYVLIKELEGSNHFNEITFQDIY